MYIKDAIQYDTITHKIHEPVDGAVISGQESAL